MIRIHSENRRVFLFAQQRAGDWWKSGGNEQKEAHLREAFRKSVWKDVIRVKDPSGKDDIFSTSVAPRFQVVSGYSETAFSFKGGRHDETATKTKKRAQIFTYDLKQRKKKGRIIKMKKTVKNIIITLLTALLLLSVSACSGNSTYNNDSDTNPYGYLLEGFTYEKPDLDLSDAAGVLKSILEKGTMIVATSPDYPPAEFVTEDGTVYGSEMMLAEYVAECLGVQLVIETMDFNGTLTAPDTGKVDISFSGYGWKADRAENYELSVGYTGSDKDYGHTLIVAAKDAGSYSELSDFIGKHILAQASSLQQMYVEDQIIALDPDGGTELELVSTLDQAILGLASGKCDAVALDEHTADSYVAQSDGQFALTGIMFDLSRYGDFDGNVALAKKGETSLMNAVNTIITFAMEKGYYAEWYTAARELAGVEE